MNEFLVQASDIKNRLVSEINTALEGLGVDFRLIMEEPKEWRDGYLMVQAMKFAAGRTVDYADYAANVPEPGADVVFFEDGTAIACVSGARLVTTCDGSSLRSEHAAEPLPVRWWVYR
jgi:hypothetical protein